MAQLRHRRNSGAEAIPRDTLQDGSLSFTARGVLGYALSLPPGWDFSAKRVAASCTADAKGSGEQAVLSAFKELELAGYRRLVKEQNAQGRWTSYAEFAYAPVPEWIEEAKVREAGRSQRKKPGPKKLSSVAKKATRQSREQRRPPGDESQVTDEDLTFPQVAPELGNPGSGDTSSGATRVSAGRTGTREPGFREPQFLKEPPTERDTHTGAGADVPDQVGPGPVCVEEFRAAAEWAIRGAIHPEADLRLDRPDRDVLVARITVLMQQGWTGTMIQNRLGGRTNARTHRPDVVLGRALDGLEAEEPPTGRAQADNVFALQNAIDRAVQLIRDNDQELTRVTTWLNQARPAEVAAWMDRSDEEIRAAAAVNDEDSASASNVASVLPTKSTAQLRMMAASRAEDLGMSAEAAARWAMGQKTWELLGWLEADQATQSAALPVAV